MSSNRALRRHHARKAVEKARRVLRIQFDSDSHTSAACVDALARKLANNLASCSCPYCGNPRKWDAQKSVQERRSELSEQDN